ncbi:MlrC C-terminus superfamily protein [Penicillium hispanicum]|uniref:MlrC C-terminus superfamily protein n=1 Tax=Penicillium hispanicum TaxID=1080232 RepID=UPI002540748E|nr:MlrC C-terminus superfamily protein [Penicillium hispanicum]KAJ5584780.1 MlrC C-terminus superfamily protein [Penicillium hispanicum]
MAWRPVIAIAGLACETSTFSPARTHAPAFHPRRAGEIIDKYAFIHPGTELGEAASWRGALIGHALPGGVVTRPAFEELAREIVTRLSEICESTTIQGLWFDIHGAMCVEGLDDVEVVLLDRIRAVIGPEVIVSASMDLHGNVSQRLAHQTDLITCYRMAPHEDARDTKERACRNLVNLLISNPGQLSRPLKAWAPVPILLPGEQTSTREEPAKGLYALVPEVESLSGVLDAAIWVGYAWADEPRNHAVVIVTGWDGDTVTRQAARLAQHFWDARKEFHFVAPTGSLTECIDAALSSNQHPFFISDSGDNPTAGGAGDVTWGLYRFLTRPEFRKEAGSSVIYASIPGPRAIETILQAGVGATVTVTAGAEVDDLHHGPISMTGRVHAIRHGDKDAVVEAVLQVGSVMVIITKLRKPFHHEDDFTQLNLQPRATDIVVVKIGYLEPELFDMAADWMLALTPGGVDQDLARLGHRCIRRPMWPFEKIFPRPPDLTPRLIPASNEPLRESTRIQGSEAMSAKETRYSSSSPLARP